MNNILQLRYALEVQRTGSISRAAENLYMGQPHLSRAIRELEESIGISIFKRTTKGVVPTDEGAEFLRHAKDIVTQMDELGAMYKEKHLKRRKFSVTVPRSDYITNAFSETLSELGFECDVHVNYCEANSVAAISNVADNINDVAVIRYPKKYEQYFLRALEEKNLTYKEIKSLRYSVVLSENHPLAQYAAIPCERLSEYPRVAYGDAVIPTMSTTKAKTLMKESDARKFISVYERGSALALLSKIKSAYMLAAEITKDDMEEYSLVQRKLDSSENECCDIFIYREGYKFKSIDNLFFDKLLENAQKII